MSDQAVRDDQLDIAAAMAFGERFMSDLSRAMVTLSCALGDRLGLFAALADGTASSSDELARETGLDPRYVREWARTMAAGGYLELDGSGDRFVLPAAQAAALGNENSPFYIGGIARLVPPLAAMVTRVEECFRTGRGLTPTDYPAAMYEAMWQMSGKWLRAMLVDGWLPLVPGLTDVLTAGARVAHLACGNGTALALLAQRFPASRFEGVDRHPLNVDQARQVAADHGVADRVQVTLAERFAGDLPGPYDLIMAFDSLHLAEDPVEVLGKVGQALAPDGVFLLLETNCSADPRDNLGDVPAFLYGTSTLYSVPLTRSAGVAPGMLGLPRPVLTELCRAAGLAPPRQLAAPTPFNVLYRIGST